VPYQVGNQLSVLRGVPQGSILDPLLFLIFTNDLEFVILNSVFKFADDSKVIGRAASDEDCLKLQKDIDAAQHGLINGL